MLGFGFYLTNTLLWPSQVCTHPEQLDGTRGRLYHLFWRRLRRLPWWGFFPSLLLKGHLPHWTLFLSFPHWNASSGLTLLCPWTPQGQLKSFLPETLRSPLQKAVTASSGERLGDVVLMPHNISGYFPLYCYYFLSVIYLLSFLRNNVLGVCKTCDILFHMANIFKIHGNLDEKHLERNLTEINELNKNYCSYYEKNL